MREAAFAAGVERRAQRWLAERTGIHETEISRIVNRRTDPGQAKALLIARELRRTPTELGWPQYDEQPGEVAA